MLDKWAKIAYNTHISQAMVLRQPKPLRSDEMDIINNPEAVKIVVAEALNKTIEDAMSLHGVTLTAQDIISAVAENTESSIAKRFLKYVELGKQAFQIIQP